MADISGEAASGVGVDAGVDVADGVGLGAIVGVGVSVNAGVGVGVGAVTTLKLNVMEAPLVPVAPVELHGVALKVWVPIEVGVNVKSNGVAESVFTTAPSLPNATLRVLAFVWAVTV